MIKRGNIVSEQVSVGHESAGIDVRQLCRRKLRKKKEFGHSLSLSFFCTTIRPPSILVQKPKFNFFSLGATMDGLVESLHRRDSQKVLS